MFKKKLLSSAMLAVIAVGISSQASAIPLASGLIISGTTFGTSSAFQFFNNSTAGETIVSLTWNLTPLGAFFDTTNNPPGLDSSPLSLGPSSSVGHTFPNNADLNGSSVLTINYNGPRISDS